MVENTAIGALVGQIMKGIPDPAVLQRAKDFDKSLAFWNDAVVVEENRLDSTKFRFRPDTVGKTSLLSDSIIDALNAALPVRFRQYDWCLAYSISEHGASINQFYRLLKNKGPTLTLIQDSHSNVFGG